MGRAFVHPIFDFAIIGGGLSLAVFAVLVSTGMLQAGALPAELIPALLLLANGSHFGATCVRLYSKPAAFQELSFFTMTLPPVMLLVLTLAVLSANNTGNYLFGLYLTLSPYHYASQTYGLAAIYSMRSGRKLNDTDQRLLWWTCMLPFFYAVTNGSNSSLGWLMPLTLLHDAGLQAVTLQIGRFLGLLTFVAPVALLFVTWRRSGRTLPLISWVLLLSNGAWWVVFDYMGAFIWGAIAHSVQYLGIVIVFHLRDHVPAEASLRQRIAPALRFYFMALAVGYALFEVLPYAYVAAGFTLAQSGLMCVAMINLHHFIADRGIWRVRQDASNRTHVLGE